MKNIKKIFLPSITIMTTFALTACGNLSNENSVWNRRREVEITETTDENLQNISYTPGTFEGTSTIRGYGGFMSVLITINDEGRIYEIEVTNHSESPDWYNMAVPLLIEQTIAAQSAEIDGVSGATYTSGAFKNAVYETLKEAK